MLKLPDVLKTIERDQVFTQLEDLFSHPFTLSVSYLGAKQISFEGYEGRIPLSALTEVYFKAYPFNPLLSPALAERITGLQLGRKISVYYQEASSLVTKRSFAMQCMHAIREYLDRCLLDSDNPFLFSPQQQVETKHSQEMLLLFFPHEFEQRWPSTPPLKVYGEDTKNPKYQASIAMLEEAHLLAPEGAR